VEAKAPRRMPTGTSARLIEAAGFFSEAINRDAQSLRNALQASQRRINITERGWMMGLKAHPRNSEGSLPRYRLVYARRRTRTSLLRPAGAKAVPGGTARRHAQLLARRGEFGTASAVRSGPDRLADDDAWWRDPRPGVSFGGARAGCIC